MSPSSWSRSRRAWQNPRQFRLEEKHMISQIEAVLSWPYLHMFTPGRCHWCYHVLPGVLKKSLNKVLSPLSGGGRSRRQHWFVFELWGPLDSTATARFLLCWGCGVCSLVMLTSFFLPPGGEWATTTMLVPCVHPPLTAQPTNISQ